MNTLEHTSPRAAKFVTERDGDLPVWVRAPKRGHEFYSGCTRAKLYEWAGKRFIRSVSIREPGRVKGVRLFQLASIPAFIEQCEVEAKTDLIDIDTGKQPQTRVDLLPLSVATEAMKLKKPL
jgi:hypothetical protein